jgi:hypothetical protein
MANASLKRKGAGRKADEIAACQRAFSVGGADDDGAVDDKQPLLPVFVVIRTGAPTRREVVQRYIAVASEPTVPAPSILSPALSLS